MKYLCLTLFLAWWGGLSGELCAMEAAEILRGVDEMRNPQMDYRVAVRVESIKPDKSSQTAELEVLVQGRDRSIVRTLAPARDRGRVLLMRGLGMWVFLPTISKPLRIPMRERLLGEVSNADVARANFSDDYTAVIEKSEKTEAGEFDVLKLAARTPEVPYSAVRLWVEKKTLRPFQAEFYAVSGRLLKTCLYRNFREFGGRVRPTRLIMNDPLVNGQYTVVDYDSLSIEAIPEKYFADDYLKKLSSSQQLQP